MTSTGRIRRSTVATIAALGILVASSCVPPAEPPPPPPPPPTAVVTPNPVVAGNFINVAPPTDTCIRDGSYSSFQAVMTTLRGVVVTQGFGFYSPGVASFSPMASGDPFVRMFVPPFVASGRYLVYLSCSNYLQSYSFSGASLTVSPAIG